MIVDKHRNGRQAPCGGLRLTPSDLAPGTAFTAENAELAENGGAWVPFSPFPWLPLCGLCDLCGEEVVAVKWSAYGTAKGKGSDHAPPSSAESIACAWKQ